MRDSLCSKGYEYDAIDAMNVAFAVSSAKRALGKLLQSRGVLTEIRVKGTDRLHPDYAGELAADKLNLGQHDLANAKDADLERWANAYLNGLPVLVRINALQSELDAERGLAATATA